jgi:hypothetical protein
MAASGFSRLTRAALACTRRRNPSGFAFLSRCRRQLWHTPIRSPFRINLKLFDGLGWSQPLHTFSGLMFRYGGKRTTNPRNYTRARLSGQESNLHVGELTARCLTVWLPDKKETRVTTNLPRFGFTLAGSTLPFFSTAGEVATSAVPVAGAPQYESRVDHGTAAPPVRVMHASKSC